jgi:hypothetical protein
MSDATELTSVSQFPTLLILVINTCPLFFSKACVLKNTFAPKLLRSMAKQWPFHFSKGDGKTLVMAPNFVLLEAGVTCFGLYSFSTIDGGLAGTISTLLTSFHSFSSSYLLFWLWSRCSLLFWVWDKPGGHHFGCTCLEVELLLLISWSRVFGWLGHQ